MCQNRCGNWFHGTVDGIREERTKKNKHFFEDINFSDTCVSAHFLICINQWNAPYYLPSDPRINAFLIRINSNHISYLRSFLCLFCLFSILFFRSDLNLNIICIFHSFSNNVYLESFDFHNICLMRDVSECKQQSKWHWFWNFICILNNKISKKKTSLHSLRFKEQIHHEECAFGDEYW